jgi:hypothetical protein
MDYKKHYDLLIQRAQQRASSKKQAHEIIGYVERHHIIPSCLGGSNTSDNIAFLTPEEHYLAPSIIS